VNDFKGNKKKHGLMSKMRAAFRDRQGALGDRPCLSVLVNPGGIPQDEDRHFAH
jgi:hypothetical protein